MEARMSRRSLVLLALALPRLTFGATVCKVPPQGVTCDHATIQAAVDASVSGQTVEILDDSVYSEDVLVNARDLTITSTEGATVDGGGGDRIFTIHDADVQVEGLTIDGGEAAGGFAVTDDDGTARLVLVDVVLDDLDVADDGGGIRLCDGCTLEMEGGSLSNVDLGSWDGGGIYAPAASTVTVMDTTFTNLNGQEGGAIYADGAAVEVTDATFLANRGHSSGGAAYVTGGGTLVLTDCDASYNSAGGNYGGAVMLVDSGGTITGCTFYQNSAFPEGAGIAVRDTTGNTVEVRESLFQQPSVYGGGGGIYWYAGHAEATLSVHDSVFDTGGPASIGLGMDLRGASGGTGTVIVTGSTFLDLRANEGGAIRAQDVASLDICRSIFDRNGLPSSSGGALFLHTVGAASIRGSAFLGNEAGHDGAAIYATATVLEVSNATFLDNVPGPSADDEGVVWVEDTDLTFRNNIVQDAVVGEQKKAGLFARWSTTGFTHEVSHNLWIGDGDGADLVEDGSEVPLGAGNLFDLDPLFVDYEEGDRWAEVDLLPQPTSPLLDVGIDDPAYLDPDGSRADIGHWGGPCGDEEAYADPDADGYPNFLDCGPDNHWVHPGATEHCDGFDEDCDAEVDEDTDGDGSPACSDCAPADASAYAGAPERCDGVLNDCALFHLPIAEIDFDGDGYVSCTPEGTWSGSPAVAGGGDCDDTDPLLSPETIWYADSDGDGFGDPMTSDGPRCEPAGSAWVLDATDCDDDDADAHPGAVWHDDADGDGYGDGETAETACVRPDGTVADATDCDDAAAAVHPGATEICDGRSDGCTGDGVPTAEVDGDGDGYVPCMYDEETWAGSLAVVGGADCDDEDATIFPNAEEVPYDGIDQDCNRFDLCDADHDGTPVADCDDRHVGATDCDDDDPTVHPGADDIPEDGTDQDCDGEDAEEGCGCATGATGGLAWTPWVLALFLVRRRTRRCRAPLAGLLLVAGLLVPAHARAVDLEVDLICPSFAFTGGGYDRTDQTCNIDYSNNDPNNAVDNVEFRLTTNVVSQSDIAPALPDGVPDYAYGGFTSQSWPELSFVWAPAGSPAPTVDYTNQVFSWTIPTIGVGATSELYFHMRTSNMFPDGAYQWKLETFVGGVLQEDLTLDIGVTWTGDMPYGGAILPQTTDPDRHFIGTAIAHAGTRPITDARVRVYLPYLDHDTGTFLADDDFISGVDTPVVDPDTLRADLFYRWSVPPNPYVEFPAGTTPDPGGYYSAPADGELNEHQLLVYDPVTNTLTGEFGVSGHLPFGQTWVYEWRDWRVRWDAEFNIDVLSIDDGVELPVDVCVEGYETGPVSAGDAACLSQRRPFRGEAYTLTGTEPDPEVSLTHVGCPVHRVGCHLEDRPIPAGADGRTVVSYRSQATVGADSVELIAQLPGSPTQGKVADLRDVTVHLGNWEYVGYGADLGPYAVGQMDIYLSDTPTDYTGSPTDTDLLNRTVPMTFEEDWVLCATGAPSAVQCDPTSVGFTAGQVTEVRAVLTDVRSQWASTVDMNREYWSLWLDWTLDPESDGSINGLPVTFDETDMADLAFGTTAPFVIDLADGSRFADLKTWASEVTRQSFAARCGSSATPTTITYCYDGFYQPNMTVLQETTIGRGLYNYGTIDNVYGKGGTDPLRICMPIPHGLKLLPTVDPEDPVRPRLVEYLQVPPYTMRILSFDEYYAYFIPAADARAQGTLCVDVPNYTLPAKHTLQALSDVRVLPGVDQIVRMQFADGTPGHVDAFGEDGYGDEIEIDLTLGAFPTIYVTGIASMTVSEAIWPSQRVGTDTEFCYDQSIDAHAFDPSGSGALDPQGATLSSTEVVLYQWIAREDQTPPSEITEPGDGRSRFTRAYSDDAIGIWVTGENDPGRGDATVLGGDWHLCAGAGEECDQDALGGLGLAPETVRWVALEYGEVRITDAEPRGQAPLDGNTRLNEPYTGTVCATDAGSGNDGLVRSQIEIRSVETPYSLVQGDIDVIIDLDCEAGSYALPETCDGTDEDCDGDADEDFTDLDDSCTTGVGACETDGTMQCTADATGTECAATNPVTPGTETCNGIDDDCDGEPDQLWPVGETCSVGVGPCEASGSWVCTVDGSGVECNATPLPAGAEICNGIDDDCDGAVDQFQYGLNTVDACGDDDGDGVYAGNELHEHGTSPFDDDTDDDGITDGAEIFAFQTDPLVWDTDQDGLSDGVEVGLSEPMGVGTKPALFAADENPGCGTDPLDDDTDDDGLLDGTEDADHNGALDAGETCPLSIDTDEDGVQDGTELSLTEPEGDGTDEAMFLPDDDTDTSTDPLDDDTDDDGLLDGTEDADGNGAVDAGETDPGDPDSDGDDILDGTESGLDWPEGDGTDLAVFVADADPLTTTDPLSADSDEGTTDDGIEDTDHDGAFEPDDYECDPNDPSDDLNCPDSDRDGIPDWVEGDGGTLDADMDDDGIPDGIELLLLLDPETDDSDGDGLLDGTELGFTVATPGTDPLHFVPDADPTTVTDPLDDDSDDDGLLDGTEDADGNGAVDRGETDPNAPDTDGDGVLDGTESGLTAAEGSDTDPGLFVADADPLSVTDPLLPDTDGGGVSDGVEDADADGAIGAWECDPNDPLDDLKCPDADHDGLGDWLERFQGTDAEDGDCDDDGLVDGTEVALGTSPLDIDTDDDGISDGVEVGLTEPEGWGTDLALFERDDDPATTTDPTDEDSDGDGLIDGVEDVNVNGRVDAGETDPLQADSDGGGVPDGEEVRRGTDPLDPLDDVESEGCGCHTTGSAVFVWVLGIALAIRRRRE